MLNRLMNRTTSVSASNRLPFLKPNSSLLLSLHCMPRQNFARYYNKAQAAAQGMKDDMLSYEFKPDVINSIIPAPRFPTPALDKR